MVLDVLLPPEQTLFIGYPIEWKATGGTCWACQGARRRYPDAGTTYFVQRGRWVKIGYTGGPVAARMISLSRPGAVKCPPEMDQTDPLTLLMVIRANVEHEAHEWYVDRHVAGEWFDLVDHWDVVVGETMCQGIAA